MDCTVTTSDSLDLLAGRARHSPKLTSLLPPCWQVGAATALSIPPSLGPRTLPHPILRLQGRGGAHYLPSYLPPCHPPEFIGCKDEVEELTNQAMDGSMNLGQVGRGGRGQAVATGP